MPEGCREGKGGGRGCMACQCKGDRVAQAVMKRIRGKRVGVKGHRRDSERRV